MAAAVTLGLTLLALLSLSTFGLRALLGTTVEAEIGPPGLTADLLVRVRDPDGRWEQLERVEPSDLPALEPGRRVLYRRVAALPFASGFGAQPTVNGLRLGLGGLLAALALILVRVLPRSRRWYDRTLTGGGSGPIPPPPALGEWL